MLLNPIIIVASLLIDLLSLPSLLLRDERNFEFKYQTALEILNKAQIHVILTTFSKIFYVNFQQKFAGKGMTLIELMIMHRKIFSLIDNLHDLCCRGTKDYKSALANVQDYNMTKILTRKCSVPDRSGDIKQSSCDFNILYSIQMDIELYNYIDIALRDFRSGKMQKEMAGKDKKKGGSEEDDKNGPKINAGVVFLPMTASPSGMQFKRDNADFMNNFFVNIAARSFTNIEEYLKNMYENSEAIKQKETLKELEGIKKNWANAIQTEVNEQFDKFDKNIIAYKKDMIEH